MGIEIGRTKKPINHGFTYQNMIKYISRTPITHQFKLLQMIGKGSYSEVYRGQHITTGNYRAIKKIDRRKHAKIEPLLLNQFEYLKQMDHPNILKIYQIYEQPNFYYIVTELCSGKELFDVLKEHKCFKEEQAAGMFQQIVSACRYMHEKGVMHRDLKPENIIYDIESGVIKLIDFGTAINYETTDPVQRRRVGTIYYIAPEVLDRVYNHKCDVWSIGVILYVLLSGEPPFYAKSDSQIMQKIKKGVFDFKNSIWDSKSAEVKMLISQMLNIDASERPEMSQITQSIWVRKYAQSRILSSKTEQCFSKFLKNMKNFQQTKCKGIQQGVLVLIINFINKSEDEAEMIKCFKQLDINGDGMISKEELTLGLQRFLSISSKQASKISQAIFAKVDTNASGFIDYSEFIVSASSLEMTVTSQNLELAFDFMDDDKNGSLSIQQLRQRLGDNISEEVYLSLLKECNLKKAKQINKKDFISMMKKLLQKG